MVLAYEDACLAARREPAAEVLDAPADVECPRCEGWEQDEPCGRCGGKGRISAEAMAELEREQAEEFTASAASPETHRPVVEGPVEAVDLPDPLYDDGRITLYCGDSAVLVEALVARHGRPHHVFTDPPYSARVVENARTSRGTKAVSAGWIGAEAPRAFVPFATEAPRAFVPFATEAPAIRSLLARANPSRWSVVFADHAHAAALDLEPPRGMRSMRLGVWVKPDGSPQMTGDRPANGFESIAILHSDEHGPRWNSGGKRGVWTHYVERDVSWHPTPKPVPLWRELLRDFTDPDDLVFDLYGGSAASGVAGRFEGRRVVLVEIDPAYARLAAQRLREGRGRLVDASMPAESKRALPLFANG